MDSCLLATVDEGRVGDLSGESAKDGNEVEVTSLEEAKSVIAALRARQRAQAQQMLAWRRTLKLQVRSIRFLRKRRGGISPLWRAPRGRDRFSLSPSPSAPPSWTKERGKRDRSKLLSLKTIKHGLGYEPMLRTVKY